MWTHYNLDPATVPWEVLDSDLFLLNPEDLVTQVANVQTMSALERWARSVDTSFDSQPATINLLKQQKAMRDTRFATVTNFRGRQIDFIQAVANALATNAVVIARAPPGYGKTVLGPLITRELELIERSSRDNDPPSRGLVTTQPEDMTKCLHLVPNVANALGALDFINSKMYQDDIVAVTAAQPMTERVRLEDSPNYVFAPYNVADQLLASGRFKMVVLDEAQMQLPEITSAIIRVVQSINSPPSTDRHSLTHAHGAKRIDKLLIYLGVNTQSALTNVEWVLNKFNVKFVSVTRPVSALEWDEKRHDVEMYHIRGIDNVRQGLVRRAIENKLARKINKQSALIETEDVAYDMAYLKKNVEPWTIERIVKCIEVAIQHFKDDEVDSRPLRADVDGKEQEPYVYGKILVFTPSSAVSKQVFDKARFTEVNRVYLRAPHHHLYYEPYKISIASHSVDGDETPLNATHHDTPELKRDNRMPDGPPMTDPINIVKGHLIIVVNGAETGLTISKATVVIESGLERVLESHSRSGLEHNIITYTDGDNYDQRLGRGGRVERAIHIAALGTSRASLIKTQAFRTRIADMKAVDTVPQHQYVRMMMDSNNYFDDPKFTRTDYNAAAIEGAVNASLFDKVVNGRFALVLNRTTLRDTIAFSFIDPFHARLLRASVACDLPAHGALLVALLTLRDNCLRRPIRGRDPGMGVCTNANAIDLFRAGMQSFPHRDEHGHRRALPDWTGDTTAIIEMHMQLIIASGWVPGDAVPNKDELTQATPDSSNFWEGASWLPCGPVRDFSVLRTRLDPRRVQLQGPPVFMNFDFLYRNLIADEERCELWAIYGRLVLALRAQGLLHGPPASILSQTTNIHVVNMATSPILNEKGRHLMDMLNTIFSNRFATITGSVGNYEFNSGKARGQMKDYYRQTADIPKPGVACIPQFINRALRAESGWNATETTILRYSPTSSSSTTTVETQRIWFSMMDPLSITQTCLFANSAGKWVVAEDFLSINPNRKWYTLEVLSNGCDAVLGLKIRLGEDKRNAEMVARFRNWLHHYFNYYTPDPTREDHFKNCVDTAVDIWKQTIVPPARPRFLPALNPQFSLMW